MVTCGNDPISWRAFEVSAKSILQHSLIFLTDVGPSGSRSFRTLEHFKLVKEEETGFSSYLHELGKAVSRMTVIRSMQS